MRIIVADDEELVLKDTVKMLQQICKNDEICAFSDSLALLEFAMENPCEIAFLDVHMGNMDGVTLARELKEISPKINIIFVTAYDDYFRQAMEMHASGYILKPIKEEDIKREIQDLRYQLFERGEKKLVITCFGSFDVKTPQGERVVFERSKSKEAFAYLIHLHGGACTTRDLAAVLFEDEPFDEKKQVYIQKIISSMMKTLKKYEAQEVVEKNFNSMSVNTQLVECDYYRFLSLDSDIGYTKSSEYMMQYSWAEY